MGTAASQPTTPLPPLSQRTLLPGRGHSRPPATPCLPSSQGEGSACWLLPHVPYPGAPAAVPRVQARMVSWERDGEGARTRRLKPEGDETHLPTVAGMPPFPRDPEALSCHTDPGLSCTHSAVLVVFQDRAGGSE